MFPSSMLRHPLAIGALIALATVSCRSTPEPHAMTRSATFAHDVYFTLKNSTPEARMHLAEECHTHLGGIDGIVFLGAGTRDVELTRDANDREYDVSLHVLFTDRAAHDAYQTAPAHIAFIEANRDTWAKVRVFDSNLVAPGR